MKNYFLFAFFLTLAFFQMSCSETFDHNEQKNQIRQRLTEEGLLDSAIETDEGIFIVITQEGIGTEMPDINSTLNVAYSGWLFETGELFDSSWGDLIQIDLNSTILGWQYAFPYFTDETKATIYIPSIHAYGNTQDRPAGITGVGIPKGSVLVFDIELKSFF